MSKDRGDRFPSDANDTAPVNPAANLIESDYVPFSGAFKSTVEIKDKFDTELRAEQPRLPAEVKVSQGLIFERTSPEGQIPKYYDVMLQDGDEINGKVLFQPPNFDFEFMESVVVIKGQEGGEWYILGGSPTSETMLDYLEQNLFSSTGPLVVGVTTTSVDACVAGVVGTGTVQPQRNINGTLTNSGTVFAGVCNPFASAIPNGTRVEIERDTWGDWYFISADC